MRRVEQLACSPGRSSDADDASEPVKDVDIADVLQQLILQCDSPERLLECYYWSQEPGLIEFIRAVLAMPADARTVLQAFFAAAVVREQVSASVDATGSVALYSPEAATIMTRFFRGASSGLSRHFC